MSSSVRKTFRRRLLFEPLEERRVLAAAFAEFIDPHPTIGNGFGSAVVPLATGNVVITSPYDDAGAQDAGAVYLFNGATGALLSTLTGSHPNDHVGVGGVSALTNGNFVVLSPNWNDASHASVGAATFGNGLNGISGAVSEGNSLVGTTADDHVGSYGVRVLTNGNYVVSSPRWANGTAAAAGAATFGRGISGVKGAVSANNSLVGSTASDAVGAYGVTALANGDYVVSSSNWHNGPVENAGAATWGGGASGISGTISGANSLVGTTANDFVGDRVTPLANGNYVVTSSFWNNGTVTDAGAVTFVSSTSGTHGTLSAANSLVGTTARDFVGSPNNGGGVRALTNGNYVVFSPWWANAGVAHAGAVTFGSGTSGVSGAVTIDNSLVGTTENDEVGQFGVTALANGNYVVLSKQWHNGTATNAGAVTFGNGTSGVRGAVDTSNSLVGSTANDFGNDTRVTALLNGNYVVSIPAWNNGISKAFIDVGAVTFGNGTSGISGAVSEANSLVGTTAGDQIGYAGVTALTNGNYVVSSPYWNNGTVTDAGAVTFGIGSSRGNGPIGAVSVANSLVGSSADDQVGNRSVTALTNGNYVVASPSWDNASMQNVGAVTLGNGTSGISGAVSAANSLIGSAANDTVGISVAALTNGNYVVSSNGWDNGVIVNAGAVTFGSGTTGVSGIVRVTNSLVGSAADDQVGYAGVAALTNGNYVVSSPYWNNGPMARGGALSFGSGTSSTGGAITTANSMMGVLPITEVRPVIVDNVNKTFFGLFLDEGRVRVGSQIDGFAHHWHLAATPLDVNHDAHVAANDVVAIVNYINAGFPSAVAADAQLGGPYGFLDVNGDDFVAPNDVLDIINAINAGMGGEGERESGGGGEGEQVVQSPKSNGQGQGATVATVESALMMWLAMDGSSQLGRRKA